MSDAIRQALTVSQLNAYVQNLLGRDPMLRGVRVQGELSGFKRHSSGHLYFSLKDQESLVRCVMFRSAAQTLRFSPRDGMQVALLADASLYTRDGQFQLYVHSMQEQGEGALYARFLQLKDRLSKKGYFDDSHKKPIPFLPACVGVITSSSGAALHDILQIISRRYPKMNITVCPVQVQGEYAAPEIARAIRMMNRMKAASVLIVGRGGGSMEDLWAFNEEKVAAAIYESEIPIISAVGHETDITIADFVADLRAPTPSAAAELCVPEYAALAQQVDSCLQRLPVALQKNLQAKKDRVRLLLKNRGFYAAEQAVANARRRLESDLAQLQATAGDSLRQAKRQAEHMLLRLQAAAPQRLLARGFALISDRAGTIISSTRQLKPAMPVTITMADGAAQASIQSVKQGEE